IGRGAFASRWSIQHAYDLVFGIYVAGYINVSIASIIIDRIVRSLIFTGAGCVCWTGILAACIWSWTADSIRIARNRLIYVRLNGSVVVSDIIESLDDVVCRDQIATSRRSQIERTRIRRLSVGVSEGA